MRLSLSVTDEMQILHSSSRGLARKRSAAPCLCFQQNLIGGRSSQDGRRESRVNRCETQEAEKNPMRGDYNWNNPCLHHWLSDRVLRPQGELGPWWQSEEKAGGYESTDCEVPPTVSGNRWHDPVEGIAQVSFSYQSLTASNGTFEWRGQQLRIIKLGQRNLCEYLQLCSNAQARCRCILGVADRSVLAVLYVSDRKNTNTVTLTELDK